VTLYIHNHAYILIDMRAARL